MTASRQYDQEIGGPRGGGMTNTSLKKLPSLKTLDRQLRSALDWALSAPQNKPRLDRETIRDLKLMLDRVQIRLKRDEG